MKKLLITGGTVFVSKYTTTFFQKKGYEVYVLNRNTRRQIDHVNLICADRNNLNDILSKYEFDAVLDICAYNKTDISNLIQVLGHVKDYILISSSAVYSEQNKQPFTEDQQIGLNTLWGAYGTGKVEAERYLLSKLPNAYILRPPYLYGPMQNIYREPFVFDCALEHRKFYIPNDGKMKLQFFHVEDLCKLMELILQTHPNEHIFNVGNEELTDINEFVELCYTIAKEPLEKVYVTNYESQRDYFSFHDYEYKLDLTRQKTLLTQTKPLQIGLKESFDWYIQHKDDVIRKEYINFIDSNLSIETKPD